KVSGQISAPGEDGVLRGIVEGVQGDEARRRRGRADGGVAEVEALRAAEAQAQMGLGSVVAEVADIGSLPRSRKQIFGVVDAVFLTQAETSGGKREPSIRRSPVNAALVAPRRLGPEARVADGGGVGVVEVKIGRQAEAVPRRGAQPDRVCEREGSGSVRGKDSIAAR